MSALLALRVTRWEGQAVILPEGPGIRITVFGDWFPIRAVEPELRVGDAVAERVEVARDLRSIRGPFARCPWTARESSCGTGTARKGSSSWRSTRAESVPFRRNASETA
jgi:hypothetical protein